MDITKSQSRQKAGKHPSSANHRTLQKSATLNRRFVKKPSASPRVIKQSQINKIAQARREALANQINREKLSKLNSPKTTVKKIQIQDTENIAIETKPAKKAITIKLADTPSPKEEKTLPAAAPNRAVARANAAVAARKATAPKVKQLSAQELKDRAISRAMQNLASSTEEESESSKRIAKVIPKKKGVWQTKKFFIAATMSLASIAALGYLVHLNLPDLSVKVAAMQSGIESAYPSYIPRGYSLDGLVSEKDGKITMTFNNNGDSDQDTHFTITEQKSPWDSTALLTQFVVPEWGSEYILTKEQGLTIYTSNSNAAWVNGGVFYLIKAPNNTLTKQQLRDIAISL